MQRRHLILAALPVLAAGAPPKLPNVVIDGAQAKVSNEHFGEIRVYFEGPTDQVKFMTAGRLRLKPGMAPHPPHEHPEEEFMVVTEGAGEISVEGKKYAVEPGSMMYCAAGKVHGIVNTGAKPLLFYYYKWLA
jgi:quercetin dioxygenase-like cupin family protein